jgi:rifampicin phosphotransferase
MIFDFTHSQLDLSLAGGKGLNLQRLVRAGFPVPPGFVVSTAAYQAFVAHNQLQERIVALSQQTEVGDMTSFAQASQTIRALFTAGEIPPAIATAVQEATEKLGGPVAVRSSATAEDLPDASFAGQQDTFLNVRGAEAVLTAVVNCWSSLWTARALAYRQQQAIAPDDVALAVVVQQMVPADVAGVLFTLNPVTGSKREMMINATWGLGEALVSGQVNPDSFILDKASGVIRSSQLGDKAVMTAVTPSGTATVAVSPSRQEQPAITPAQAVTLARLGREIESYFGQPQDIEWAFAGDAVYILQARPVTVTGGVPGDDDWPPFDYEYASDFDLWTQADVGERWPEPISPFTWSVWVPITQANMMVSFTGAIDEKLRSTQWIKRAYGRAYLNEGAIGFGLNHAFGMPASSGAASFAAPELIPPHLNKYRWGTLLKRIPLLLKMVRTWEKNGAYYESRFPQIDAWVEAFFERDLSRPTDLALWQEVNGVWYERMMEYITYHANVTGMATTAYGQMEQLVARVVGQKQIAQTLTSGLSDVIAAEIVPLLWAMAQEIKAAGLADVILNNEAAVALALLRERAEARPFLDQLAHFLQRHGHRCMSEAEYRHPRWREAPEQVILSLTGYLQLDAGQFDPHAGEESQRRKREEATALVAAKLDPLRRRYFNSSLKRLQRLMRLRDNGQHFLVKLIMPARVIYAEIARRWAERGWLATADDFYFLVFTEVEQTVQAGGPDNLNLSHIAAARRQAHTYWFSQPFPEVLDAQGNPVAAAANDDPHRLQGIAASQGQVTGIARVIHTPQEATRLQPGEILVTRATDPGWTPVFSVISGLVLEVGGQLSHGAIVAREYGLPAVVNVAGATQKISDGDKITVDGGQGCVLLNTPP